MNYERINQKQYSQLILYLAGRISDFNIPANLILEAELPPTIKIALKSSFCTYKQACETANDLFISLHKQGAIVSYCQQSKIGKKLPTALYVHTSALERLHLLIRLYESFANRFIVSSKIDELENLQITEVYPPEFATIIKFHFDKPKISYLYYPDFDKEAHPALHRSIQIDIHSGEIDCRNYANNENPPILHRKETFVNSDYPHYEQFVELTCEEERLGLLKNTRGIGTLQGWLKKLERYGVEIREHGVIRVQKEEIKTPVSDGKQTKPKIERHKAAIKRKELSKPVRLALEANLFTTTETTFFDYGCGYGGDFQGLAKKGYQSSGWDPYYCPQNSLNSADVVNLGYVINVIESLSERREALLKAWELTKKVLIVSAQVLIYDRQSQGQLLYSDGIITARNTFQKYYEQEELKIYIDQVLNVNSIPVGLGIYFVFRDETEAENFRASRFRRSLNTPRISSQNKRFEDYQEQLAPLMAFMSDRGRFPLKNELPEEENILAEFGNFRRAFQVILQATEATEWDKITDKRRQDLLVYIALTAFGDRPIISQFSLTVQNDIKGLFGSYKKACNLADLMLFSLGKPEVIAKCCRQSSIGLKLSNSLWVHISAISELDSLLRLYEGCASRTIGRMEDATAIKFYTQKPKIAYLFYPDFDTEAHPVLQAVMEIDLRDLRVSYYDYSDDYNPPILHRKDSLVLPDYPLYEKFATLTRQEEDRGLLDDWQAIKNYRGWLHCLEQHCTEIKGHRLFWRKDADAYRLKLLKSAVAFRKRKRASL
jgi:DNA phosphorothioation-associated putative methyltransferase